MENRKPGVYEGGDPDSLDAYFSVDISGPEGEDVLVDNFVWSRRKSNENIKDAHGKGKGFSFYYARRVFVDDDDSYEIYNEQNPDNFKTLGIVYEKVMVVINCMWDDDRIRIISAWELDDESDLGRRYWARKSRRKNRGSSPRREEPSENRERGETKFTCDEDKDVVFAFVSKRARERQSAETYQGNVAGRPLFSARNLAPGF